MGRLYSIQIDNCDTCPNVGEAINQRVMQPICWAVEGVREDNWLEWGDFETEADACIPIPEWCPLPLAGEGER